MESFSKNAARFALILGIAAILMYLCMPVVLSIRPYPFANEALSGSKVAFGEMSSNQKYRFIYPSIIGNISLLGIVVGIVLGLIAGKLKEPKLFVIMGALLLIVSGILFFFSLQGIMLTNEGKSIYEGNRGGKDMVLKLGVGSVHSGFAAILAGIVLLFKLRSH